MDFCDTTQDEMIQLMQEIAVGFFGIFCLVQFFSLVYQMFNVAFAIGDWLTEKFIQLIVFIHYKIKNGIQMTVNFFLYPFRTIRNIFHKILYTADVVEQQNKQFLSSVSRKVLENDKKGKEIEDFVKRELKRLEDIQKTVVTQNTTTLMDKIGELQNQIQNLYVRYNNNEEDDEDDESESVHLPETAFQTPFSIHRINDSRPCIIKPINVNEERKVKREKDL